ncbi:hypothetical protein LTR62_007002 [Meristemomyces frigidus]|uniref:Uncharacterized protein n=1 Tax=Meristemomyces frigidus TaxID=1508187 RepID=A0AAN7TCA2_9PEZI|nr:hypothetical protein LTR62_007002 [Meristemomyces frigidus]
MEMQMQSDWTMVPAHGYSYSDALAMSYNQAESTAVPWRAVSTFVATRKKPTKRRKVSQPTHNADDFISRSEAVNYSLAGRDPAISFCDLRSAAKARRRHATRQQKYYSFRAVNPGQIGVVHYTKDDEPGVENPSKWYYECPLPEAQTTIMEKQTLYHEAQFWPRPPNLHHRSTDKMYGMISARREARFRAAKHPDYKDHSTGGWNDQDTLCQFLASGDSANFWRDVLVENERESWREACWCWCWYSFGHDEEERWRACRVCGKSEVLRSPGGWRDAPSCACVHLPRASFDCVGGEHDFGDEFLAGHRADPLLMWDVCDDGERFGSSYSYSPDDEEDEEGVCTIADDTSDWEII